MSRLRSFLRLSGARRRSLLVAAVSVAAARLLLWVLPYAPARALLGGGAPRERRRADAALDAHASSERIARDVALVAGVIPGATCLVQALAGERLLARAGIASVVRIGVQRHARGIEAHAWLESAGRVLLGAPDRPFTELTSAHPLSGSAAPDRSPRP